MYQEFSSYLLTGCLNPLGIQLANHLTSNPTVNSINLIDSIQASNTKIPSSLSSNPDFSLYLGDIRNDFLVKKILSDKKVECIIFFIPSTRSNDAIYGARTCIDGMIQVLDAARDCQTLKSFVVVSSDMVYGNSAQSENSILLPENFIGAAEMGAEAMAHSYMMSYKLPIGIVRLASGVVHNGDIVDKQRLEGGRDFINLLDMNDAIRGILLVAGHAINAEVWNLGGTKEYPIDQVKNKLFDNSVTLSERQASLNTDKIRSLGWIPNDDIIIESTHKNGTSNGNTVDYHLKPKVLVYGARGWVGQQLIEELEKNGEFDIVEAHKKPGSDPDSEILDEIVSHTPSHIVCTVGRTHGPGVNSIAYLEGGPDKLKENMRDNLYAPWLLASLCEKLHIHCTYIGTGCIYKYDYEHEIGGMEYKEDDVSNYSGTSYSVVKGFTDRLLRQFPNTLQCRIRLPINYKSEDRNLVAKIIKFNALVDIPNSVTVLPDILPVIIDLMMKRNSGIWNLVNPNPISFAKIGEIYKDHFNNGKNFEILEAIEDLLNSRSNCALSVDKLLGEYPNIPNSEKAIKIAIGSVVKDQKL